MSESNKPQPGFPRTFEWRDHRGTDTIVFHEPDDQPECLDGCKWTLKGVTDKGDVLNRWTEVTPAPQPEQPPVEANADLTALREQLAEARRWIDQRKKLAATGDKEAMVARYHDITRSLEKELGEDAWLSPVELSVVVVLSRLGEARGKLAEVERERDALLNPKPGDIESQAAAWVAVWGALEKAGLLSFIGSMSHGRTRAVEFIGCLAAERDAALAETQTTETPAKPGRSAEYVKAIKWAMRQLELAGKTREAHCLAKLIGVGSAWEHEMAELTTTKGT